MRLGVDDLIAVSAMLFMTLYFFSGTGGFIVNNYDNCQSKITSLNLTISDLQAENAKLKADIAAQSASAREYADAIKAVAFYVFLIVCVAVFAWGIVQKAKIEKKAEPLPAKDEKVK